MHKRSIIIQKSTNNPNSIPSHALYTHPHLHHHHHPQANGTSAPLSTKISTASDAQPNQPIPHRPIYLMPIAHHPMPQRQLAFQPIRHSMQWLSEACAAHSIKIPYHHMQAQGLLLLWSVRGHALISLDDGPKHKANCNMSSYTLHIV